MPRALIAILFTLIISMVIVTPTVITMVKGNCDLAIFFDAGEDEENKNGKESIKDLEIKVFYIGDNEFSFIENDEIRLPNTYNNTYNSVYRQIFSPPPEHNIL